MIKVTFCAHDYPNFVGGPYAWLPRLLPSLRERGIESRVLFSIRGNEEECQGVQRVKQEGFNHSVYQIPYHTDQHINWILQQLKKDPPDIFVPHLVVPAFYASRWVKKAGIPTIGVMHSDDPFYHGLVDEFVFGQPDYQLSGLVCVSRFIEQTFLNKITSTQIRCIPCGVPIPRTLTKKPSEKLKILYVGRLVEEQKQISLLTKAFCRAVKEVPNTEAIIYGSGSKQGAVEKILAQHAQDIPVKLGGRLNSDQVQKHLLGSHVIVLLSDYEGLPIALMEAMACGVVPVCLRIRSGIPELVEDSVTGLLVDDRGDSFVAAIRRLQEETGLWEKLSQGARAKIEADYSDTVAADQWADFIRELHQTAGRKQSIQRPLLFSLPPVHPALAVEDKRRPPLVKRIRYKLRSLVKSKP
ncbi:putative glycosyl transferase, group I [Crocosphaera subtropica ATCC 51142]|uniref:Glycosyl transferase, group I n=1 Tax=Crocosphaera subtropica (strain ATCC 51142 / BH68) TaxID=43989 RepID=B1WQK1_CROS5|nr:glycosyltransferase family 4 protein [Crocosphaera subtropica]ACB51712.1 putative glycosyl transferase, group I [Crocosphaera subtropica ATCC 51142]